MGSVVGEKRKKGHSYWTWGMTPNFWSPSVYLLVYFVGSPPWVPMPMCPAAVAHWECSILNWDGFLLSCFCVLLHFSYFSVFKLHMDQVVLNEDSLSTVNSCFILIPLVLSTVPFIWCLYMVCTANIFKNYFSLG